MKHYFFIFLIILLIFLSGCSKAPDCSLENTKYTIYKYDEVQKKCVVAKEIKKNVCGNDIAEKGETACNCDNDVDLTLPLENGGCSGNKGDFLTYQCNTETKSCDLIVTEKVKKNSKLLSMKDSSDFALDAQVYYYTPFMIDRHKVEINLMLKEKTNNSQIRITNLEIVKVYIVTTSNELMGTVDVNRKLTTQYENFDMKIPIDAFTFNTFDKDMTNVNLKLLIRYDKVYYDDAGKVYKTEPKSVEIKEIFEQKFKLINPANKAEDLSKTSGGWG